MTVRAHRWPPRRRLSVVLFKLFAWPFAVRNPPYISHAEFHLDLRPGIRPTSDREIDRALGTIPGLEPDIIATLRAFLREAFSPHQEAPEVGITVAKTHVRVRIVPPNPDGLLPPDLEALADRWSFTLSDGRPPFLRIDRAP